jgi:hypothetical protein
MKTRRQVAVFVVLLLAVLILVNTSDSASSCAGTSPMTAAIR